MANFDPLDVSATVAGLSMPVEIGAVALAGFASSSRSCVIVQLPAVSIVANVWQSFDEAAPRIGAASANLTAARRGLVSHSRTAPSALNVSNISFPGTHWAARMVLGM